MIFIGSSIDKVCHKSFYLIMRLYIIVFIVIIVIIIIAGTLPQLSPNYSFLLFYIIIHILIYEPFYYSTEISFFPRLFVWERFCCETLSCVS